MTVIPKTHPRAESLLIRERLVKGFEEGLVAKEGLLAQGRGEAFDYLLGEQTNEAARRAIRAAAAQILLADRPVISVNGNISALVPESIVKLANKSNGRLEVNLFYADRQRRQAIIKTLQKNGGGEILGSNNGDEGDDAFSSKKLDGVDSARRFVDSEGIFAADVVVVPLEDGDRTAALRRMGKTVITFDLNPLSRTAQTANITIVDNVTRAVELLIDKVAELSESSKSSLQEIVKSFDNKENLQECVKQIKDNLEERGAGIAQDS